VFATCKHFCSIPFLKNKAEAYPGLKVIKHFTPIIY
jgi:hypothetical protein